MLTRRHFLTMTLIMLVLFAMFQVTGVLKEYWNDYDKNEYADSTVSELSRADAFLADDTAMEESDRYVILIGEPEDNTRGQMVKLWATYRKMDFYSYDALGQITMEQAQGAVFLFLDSDYLDFDSDTELLYRYAKKGVSMVFTSLPEVAVINSNDRLRVLLGIYYVYKDEVELTGVELYDGFLLGGTTIYQAEDETEEKQQDLSLNVPWYSVYSGTKTYITGLMDKEAYGGEEALKNESLPAIVWRNSIGAARVFVVSGDYADDVTALGLYSGMLYEMEDYSLYPVVDAQNLMIADFAAFSSEQDETMQSLYSRSQKVTFQDLIWPDLSSIYTKSQDVPSFFIAPKLDYTSDEEPDAKNLTFYQKLFREVQGENGLTLSQISDVTAEEKLKQDLDFYAQNLSGYVFCALFAEDWDAYCEVADEIEDTVKTVCTGVDSTDAPVSYADGNVTMQRATVDGFVHTYSDDLRTKSLQTCLGYSNILVDLKTILVPESDEDRWETKIERLASYTVTYWKPFTAFTKTTVSQSDERIRRFLGLDYEESRSDDLITLRISDMEEQASFILRTHNEEIEEVTGAEWTEIEDYAYLLTADEQTVSIRLKKEQNLLYTDN